MKLPAAHVVRIGDRLRRFIALDAIHHAIGRNIHGATPTIMREGTDAYAPIAIPIAGPGAPQSR